MVGVAAGAVRPSEGAASNTADNAAASSALLSQPATNAPPSEDTVAPIVFKDGRIRIAEGVVGVMLSVAFVHDGPATVEPAL